MKKWCVSQHTSHIHKERTRCTEFPAPGGLLSTFFLFFSSFFIPEMKKREASTLWRWAREVPLTCETKCPYLYDICFYIRTPNKTAPLFWSRNRNISAVKRVEYSPLFFKYFFKNSLLLSVLSHNRAVAPCTVLVRMRENRAHAQVTAVAVFFFLPGSKMAEMVAFSHVTAHLGFDWCVLPFHATHFCVVA